MYDDHANNRTNATELTLGTAQSGMIEVGNDKDCFKVELVAGQRYLFEMGMPGYGALSYGSLTLQSAAGSSLLAESDSKGFAYTYTPTTSGTYYLEASGYWTDRVGGYSVQVSESAADDHGDTRTTATALTLGSTQSGAIEVGNDKDYFKVDLVAGQRYLFEMSMPAYSTLSDSKMTLQDALGSTLMSDYDGGSYVYAPTASGSYYLQVDGYYTGSVGGYVVKANNLKDGVSENEILIGTSAAERLQGNAGNDSLDGKAGADTLIGGAGVDTVSGGTGNDTYVVNITVAGALEDVVRETSTLATEIDTVNLLGVSTNTSAVTLSLATAVLRNIEHLDASRTESSLLNLTGNAVANKLTGNAANNVLKGGAGNDILIGKAGNDTLIGGAGKDVLTGGVGNDVFDFDTLAQSGLTNATRDVITDFVSGQDKIDLSTLDANAVLAGNQAFTGLIGANVAFSQAGQLKLVSGVLYGNTDADVAAEFSIALTGITTLVNTDFVL